MYKWTVLVLIIPSRMAIFACPDQTAPAGAICYGSILFAQALPTLYLGHYGVLKSTFDYAYTVVYGGEWAHFQRT